MHVDEDSHQSGVDLLLSPTFSQNNTVLCIKMIVSETELFCYFKRLYANRDIR